MDLKSNLQEVYEFIMKTHKNQSGIIYCSTRSECENVAKQLRGLGLSIAFYHAGKKKIIFIYFLFFVNFFIYFFLFYFLFIFFIFIFIFYLFSCNVKE